VVQADGYNDPPLPAPRRAEASSDDTHDFLGRPHQPRSDVTIRSASASDETSQTLLAPSPTTTASTIYDILRFNSAKFDCPICYETVAFEACTVMACRHVICTSCFDRVLPLRPHLKLCPICREVA
jgi:hypothetical protein